MNVRLTAAVAVAVAACATDPSRSGPAPAVESATVAASPTSVLAAVVTTTLRGADSVRVLFRTALDAVEGATPIVAAADSQQIVVLGLLPERAYTFHVGAYRNGRETLSDAVALTTGALPADLPSYTASGTAPSPGFVAFAAGKYGLVIDKAGRVVWYHHFGPDGPGLNFMAQSNGRYAARPPAQPGNAPMWVEVDPAGHVTRTFGCAGGLIPRFHDLIRAADDSYWLMCDDTRTMDLSAFGGKAIAQVTGTEIQHVRADGTPLFRWNPFDHFVITDLDPAERSGSTVNWTHGNAITLDADGNLLASFRSLNEITSIDTRTGEIRWRFGGIRNEFGLTGCCAPTFARQHGLRVMANGRLLMLDNSGTPGDTRFLRFAVNPAARTADLEVDLSAAPPTVANLGGSVQELPGGRTLVAFGDGRRVAEYGPDGTIVWKIDGDAGYVFRAQRIASLYAPGVGTAR